MHSIRQNLEERLRILNDARKAALGGAAPLVCRVCFMILADDDIRSCVCNRQDWTTIDVAIIEIELLMDTDSVAGCDGKPLEAC